PGRSSSGPPWRWRHPFDEPCDIEQSGALAGRANGDLATNCREEVAVEVTAWVFAHDVGPHGIDQLETGTADVEACRPVEEDGLHPVVERHRRLHVEHDRAIDALG